MDESSPPYSTWLGSGQRHRDGHRESPGITNGIGDSPLRPDGLAKVAGTFAFSSDLPIDGAVWGATLRSPHPYARIVSIDATPALAMPGVHAVLTADDVPGKATYGLIAADQPVFASDWEISIEMACDHHISGVIHCDGIGYLKTTRAAADPLMPQFYSFGPVKLNHRKVTISIIVRGITCSYHIPAATDRDVERPINVISGTVNHLTPQLCPFRSVKLNHREVATGVQVRGIACSYHITCSAHRDRKRLIPTIGDAINHLTPQLSSCGPVKLDYGQITSGAAVCGKTGGNHITCSAHRNCKRLILTIGGAVNHLTP